MTRPSDCCRVARHQSCAFTRVSSDFRVFVHHVNKSSNIDVMKPLLPVASGTFIEQPVFEVWYLFDEESAGI